MEARGRATRGGALAALLALPMTAAAAPGITFIAPSGARAYPDQSEGPAGYVEAPTAFRTTDTRPAIGIQADGGTQLVCHFDNVFSNQPCGGPAPGCSTALCGSFQPSAPLGADSSQFSRGHFLAVDVEDADGNALNSVWLNLDIDTTPPATHLDSQRGVLTPDTNSPSPLRPIFTYQVTDSNSVGNNVDTAACSWTPAAIGPAFRPCADRPGFNSLSPGPLAHGHRLYRLEIRGTDDFGRSTTAAAVYDPTPCALSIRRPAGIAGLVASGIQTRLSCDTIRHVTVAVYAFMVNGQRSTTPRGAVSDNPILGQYKISSRVSTFSVAPRLRLFGAARAAVRQDRSLGLVLAAGDPDKILAGLADDGLSYQSFTLGH